MRLIGAVALVVCWLAGLVACGAQDLQLAELIGPRRLQNWLGRSPISLGPGQAQLTVRNLSTIQVSEVPAIRKLLEQDLKSARCAGWAERKAPMRFV